MAKICSFHKTEAQWKTGTSKKTGKDYAFWSCSSKMPDGSFCQNEIIEGTVPNPTSAKEWEDSLSTDSTLWREQKAKETNVMMEMAKLKAKEYALEAAGRVVSALISRPDFEIAKSTFQLTLDYAKEFEKYLLPDSTASTPQVE